MNEGRLMVGYQPLNDKVNFFRWVVSNPAASKHDVDYMLDEIERLGHDLWERQTKKERKSCEEDDNWNSL